MDESSVTQNRRSRRSHVFLAAEVVAEGSSATVKLRNLSSLGALVEGKGLPSPGATVLFRKGELELPGVVAWNTGNRSGIAFDKPLAPEAVLRHVPSPRPRAKLDFRRPPIKARELSAGERKIAEDWIFGRPAPTVGD